MRFHITLTHTPETCQAAHGSGPTVADWGAQAKATGIELVAGGQCPPQHEAFFFVETDDMSKIMDFLRPVLGYHQADITPVRAVTA